MPEMPLHINTQNYTVYYYSCVYGFIKNNWQCLFWENITRGQGYAVEIKKKKYSEKKKFFIIPCEVLPSTHSTQLLR